MSSTPLQSLRISEALDALETRPDGLTRQEAEERMAAYGPNSIAEPPVAPHWRRLLSYVTHPMALLLWAAGLLATVGGRPSLGIVIWVVVLVNGGFSFWREYQAEQAVSTLRRLLPSFARVIRDGAEVKIPSCDLVPGDILVLAEAFDTPRHPAKKPR